MSLKSTLINIGLCIDNLYLEKYIDLIEQNRNTKKERFKTQKHHIIPRCFYKANGTKVDNSEKNTVNLSYRDHILAHYYLAMCTSGVYKYSCIHSFLYLYKIIENRDDIVLDKEFLRVEISKLEYFENLYHEDKLLESKNLSGGKWMTDGVTQRYVRPRDMKYFESVGFKIGKLPFTEKQYEALKTTIQKYHSGKHHSQEWNKNISRGNKGRKIPPEVFKKMHKFEKGYTPWNKGLTKETSDKIASLSTSGSSKTQFKKGNEPWNFGLKNCFSMETRMKMSSSAKLRSCTTAGRVSVYRNSDDSQKFIKKEELDKYLSLGYTLGKRPVSEETRKRLSEARKGRHKNGNKK